MLQNSKIYQFFSNKNNQIHNSHYLTPHAYTDLRLKACSTRQKVRPHIDANKLRIGCE